MARRFKTVFTFEFSKSDLVPALVMQNLMRQDFALNRYLQQAVISEGLMRGQKNAAEAGLFARVSGDHSISSSEVKGERETTTSYTISYYNPELGSTEVLEKKTSIKTKDAATRVIEESVGMHSALPVYGFIAQPLLRKEVVPWKLQQILSEREYGTPPPPPTGAAVVPVRVVAVKAADKKRDHEIQAILSETVLRKEKSESRLGSEIMILEDAIEAIKGGGSIEKLIKRLPPLSRARYLILIRKKGLGRAELVKLLMRDLAFMKMLKGKLEMFTRDDLVRMYKLLRGLQKR